MKIFCQIFPVLASLSVAIDGAAGFQLTPADFQASVRRASQSTPRQFALMKQKHSDSPRHAIVSSSALRYMVAEMAVDNSVKFLQNTDFWVFVAGVFPFAWATVEFWRRIAFGEAFGTGSDSVVIGMDDSPADSRGRRVLGKGALTVAYILFILSFGTIGIVLYSVISSDAPPEVLPSLASTQVEIENIIEN